MPWRLYRNKYAHSPLEQPHFYSDRFTVDANNGLHKPDHGKTGNDSEVRDNFVLAAWSSGAIGLCWGVRYSSVS